MVLAGADVNVLERTGRKVSVTGIDDHELAGLDIVTCVALIQTMAKSTHSCMNMPTIVEVLPSILQVK